MFREIEVQLKDRLSEIVFIELAKDIKFNNSDFVLKKDIPLPLKMDKIVNQVKTEKVSDDFDVNGMIEGIVYLLGVDSEFVHKDYYVDILKNINPTIVNDIVKSGIYKASNNRIIEGMIDLKAALIIDDISLDALYNYSRILENLALKETDEEKVNMYLKEAYESLKKIQVNYPDNYISYFHLGFHYANEGFNQKAKETWDRALSMNIPDDIRDEILKNLLKIENKVRFEKGRTFILEGRIQEGLELLHSLETEESDWVDLNFYLGLAYRYEGTFDRALNYFNKCDKLSQNNDNILNEIGICSMMIGDYEKAKNVLERSLQIKKDNPEILCNLGLVYYQLQEDEKAEKLLKAAYKLDPEDEIVVSWIQKLGIEV